MGQGGSEVQEGRDMCIHIDDLLHYILEINATL